MHLMLWILALGVMYALWESRRDWKRRAIKAELEAEGLLAELQDERGRSKTAYVLNNSGRRRENNLRIVMYEATVRLLKGLDIEPPAAKPLTPASALSRGALTREEFDKEGT